MRDRLRLVALLGDSGTLLQDGRYCRLLSRVWQTDENYNETGFMFGWSKDLLHAFLMESLFVLWR